MRPHLNPPLRGEEGLKTGSMSKPEDNGGRCITADTPPALELHCCGL
jgi:hypothetical protein